MANYQTPAQLCAMSNGRFSAGVCMPAVRPGQGGRGKLERVLADLRYDIATVGLHVALDAESRKIYIDLTRHMSVELTQKAEAGLMTWEEAANAAQAARNEIMDAVRARTTPVGRAYAESLKRHGKTLETLIVEKTEKLFGKGAVFDALDGEQRNQVFAEIVASAGRGRKSINAKVLMATRAGRGLLIFSAAISVYTIATADDKVDAAKHEAAATGASIVGGIAGGAAAGLACGPGAPVCVTIGAFVGGTLAAIGVDHFHLW